jgi:hypothetical protein
MRDQVPVKVARERNRILRDLAAGKKLAFLRTTGVEDWPLEPLNPNRLKFLAHLTRKSSAQALQRAPGTRRYPMLVAFLSQALTEVTDEVIEMFDRCLAEAYARAGQDLEDFRKAMAQAKNEKVHLFRELARGFRSCHYGSGPRPAIYNAFPRRPSVRPRRNPIVLSAPWTIAILIFETRYGYLDSVPTFLETFTFHSPTS